MFKLKEGLLNIIMKKLIFGILISFVTCDFANTEICSVYNNIPSSKYYNNPNTISNVKSYDLKRNGKLLMNLKINFECNSLIFNAKNISIITGIRLQNSNDHKKYTADIVSLYENGILKISFTKNIPPGNYNLHFNYNYNGNLPAILSEWLVLTNFDENNVDKKNNETIRIWIRKSALGHGKYLMENAKNLLVAFKNYTGATYNENKYVKLDLFVLPKSTTSKYHRGDFIYVDEETFVNEEYIATKNNEKLFRTIAELMVNQAFANYNPSRLNVYGRYVFKLREYLVYTITDQAIKSWHLLDEYARLQRYGIFESDFLFSHINEYDMFDNYPSNGLEIRMLKHTVGKEYFVNILREYLQNRTEIKETNIFTKLLEMSGDRKQLLENALANWMNTIGYPIVTITRNDTTKSVTIKQSRFLRNSNEVSLIRYWIPLNFANEDNPNFDDTTVTQWFDPSAKTVNIPAPPVGKWLICNKQQFGYYRVNYDEVNWKLIIHYLKSKNYYKIHVLNRAQLIDDAFVLAEFGYLNFNIAFDLSRYLKVETEYVPWATFWEKMFRLFQYSSISSSRYWEPFKNMILELSGPLERKLLSDEASDGNDRMERLTKISFIKWTCFYGSTLCRNYSLSKLKNWLADPVQNPLLEDIRGEILCAGIRSANEETWNKLLDKFLINKDNDILHALMCSSNYELLDKLMMMFIDGQLIQINIWYFMIRIAQRSTNGLDVIISFLHNNKEAIYERENHYDIIDNVCVVIEQFINKDTQLEKYYTILRDNQNLIRGENAVSYYLTAIDRVRHANLVVNRINN